MGPPSTGGTKRALSDTYQRQLPWLLDMVAALVIDTVGVLVLALGMLLIDHVVSYARWSEGLTDAWERLHFCIMVSLTAVLAALCAFDILYAKYVHIRRDVAGRAETSPTGSEAPAEA